MQRQTSKRVSATPFSPSPEPMVQDEPNVADMNEGTSTPLATPQAPSFETPSMATDVPLTDLAAVDPIAH